MLLVLPAIDLSGGACVRCSGDRVEPESQFFADPVRMAKLWRVMNARVLHLADVDAAAGRRPAGHAADVVARVTSVLDIPVQASGGLRSADDARLLLDAGAARVVLEPDTPVEAAAEAIATLGASRIVPSVQAGDSPEDMAVELARRGARRLVGRLDGTEGQVGPNIAGYRAVAEALRADGQRVRLTSGDVVRGYPDLLALRSLTSVGVDSAVIGRSLYEGRFPCQQFWCWHQKDAVDLDRFSTAPLATRS